MPHARARSINSAVALLITAIACFVPSIGAATNDAPEVTADSYANRGAKGVVLLDANWGRRWNCAGYENAELRSLSFDRIPPLKTSDETAPDLSLEQPSSLLARPTFINYALLVEPGKYLMSGFKIKMARSVSDVAYWIAKRSDLIKDGDAQAGAFVINAGETVYIGNFYLDCYQYPQPWRYYTEGSDNFKKHLAQYKEKYPFLDLDHVTYRLFETTKLGEPYSLDQK
jgi:hypothetical protein